MTLVRNSQLLSLGVLIPLAVTHTYWKRDRSPRSTPAVTAPCRKRSKENKTTRNISEYGWDTRQCMHCAKSFLQRHLRNVNRISCQVQTFPVQAIPLAGGRGCAFFVSILERISPWLPHDYGEALAIQQQRRSTVWPKENNEDVSLWQDKEWCFGKISSRNTYISNGLDL
jgi:hypothetical protein